MAPWLPYAFLCLSVATADKVPVRRHSTARKQTVVALVAPEAKPVHCSAADSDMHVVFSTGCNAFQNWQAEVLLNSAYHVGQCGKMTRILVGCDAEHQSPDSNSTNILIEDVHFMKSTFPNLRVHLAPSIPEATEFPWFNKPWSFHHWLQHNPGPLERVIAIIDPDEFFLRPLTQRGGVLQKDGGAVVNGHLNSSLLLSPLNGEAQTDVVQPGMAVAQAYGLGHAFLDLIDKKTICPGKESSRCASLSEEDADKYQNSGPPYLLHRDDFKKVAPLWWDLMKPVYKAVKDDIQADMYAYAYAAVHQGINHSLFTQYMLSNVEDDGSSESWNWIDNLDSLSCHNPEFTSRSGFVHAAQHYKACSDGDETNADMGVCPSPGQDLWNFHKAHVPGKILACDHPLLMPPPDDLFNRQVKKHNMLGKRGAFMVCNLIFMVNRASLEYKQKFCDAGFNAKKCTRLVTDLDVTHPFNATNPWGYPLAMVDGACCPECGPASQQ